MRHSVWLLVVLVGCAAAQKRSGDSLELAVKDYNESLKWKRHHQASARVDAVLRDHFLDRASDLEEDIRLHHHRVVRVRFHPQGNQAKVHLKVTWYKDSEAKLHNSHVVQDWKLRGKIWVVSAQHHLRGPEIPTTEALTLGDKDTPMSFDDKGLNDVHSP